MLDPRNGIDYRRLGDVLWCQVNAVVTICLLVIPIVYGASDSGLTALAAAIPAVSDCKPDLQQLALKPMAWVTTVLAVLLIPVYAVGLTLIPLAWSHWLLVRRYRRIAASSDATGLPPLPGCPVS